MTIPNSAKDILHDELLDRERFQLADLYDRLGQRLRAEGIGVPERDILALIWDYFRSGILAPGIRYGDPTFPWLRVTERGLKILKGRDLNPYDEDSYVSHLRGKVPSASETVISYIWQASRALQGEAYLAAAVMIGAASEAAVWELAESVETYLTGQPGHRTFKRKVFPAKQDKWMSIRPVFQTVRKEVEKVKGDLPRTLQEWVESDFAFVFGLIRKDRNEAGHPTGRADITQEDVESSLLVFPRYYERITELAGWMRRKAPALASNP